MLSTVVRKTNPAGSTTIVVSSNQTYLLTNANALRADILGNIYIYGKNGASNITKYNTATGASTTLTGPTDPDALAGWDVDNSGAVYYHASGGIAGQIVAQYGSYGPDPTTLFSLNTNAATGSLSVSPDGTVISIIGGTSNLTIYSYSNWTTMLSTSSNTFTMPVGSSNGQLGMSVQDSFGNVYVGLLKGSAVTVPVFKYVVGSVGGAGISQQSSNAYNSTTVAYTRFAGGVYTSTSTSLYSVNDYGDQEDFSNFTNIQGLTNSLPSGSAYVLDYGTGANGTLTEFRITYY